MKPEAEIGEAYCLMIQHDYSQLPIINTSNEMKGYVSWKSIGEAHAVGKEISLVIHCIFRETTVLNHDMNLLDAVKIIISKEVVMVRGQDGKLKGPITTTDLAHQYNIMAEPFILIGNIEFHMRSIIEHLRNADQFVEGKEKIGLEEITFEKFKPFFSHSNLEILGVAIQKICLMELIEQGRVARNNMVHFKSSDATSQEEELRALKRLERVLARIHQSTLN